MSKQLQDYVKIYRNWIDKETCNQVREQLEQINWKQHTFYQPETGDLHTRSGSQELDVSWDFIPANDIIMPRIWAAINKYIRYDLDKTYFTTWSGHTTVRYNRYLPNRLMALHCDHIHSMFDGPRKGIPILTVLGMLNDDYEGGEFLLYDEEEKIELKQGDVIVFPSVFLYPHKVSEVTKGVRDSFVSWVW